MVDDALTKISQGEEEGGFHADNCFGQNKNWYVLAYMTWRIIVGLHNRITYMMQIPGQTKCLVDTGFAHAKLLYRRTDTDTIFQLADIFNKSSSSNEALLYQDAESADVIWEWRDWKTFFVASFKPLKGISKYHILKFSDKYPGEVVALKTSSGDEEQFVLLKEYAVITGERPDPVHAAGLSTDRQQYLFKHVCPYVREMFRDVTCPPPDQGAEE